MIIGEAFFLHLWLLDLQPIRLGSHLLLVGSRSTQIYASFAYGHSQSSFIFRNHKGLILWASSHSHHCLNSLIPEALALHDACKFINQLKIKDAIFESDSFNAITFIINNVSSEGHRSIPDIEEIGKFRNTWSKWRFKFTRRNANGASHALAQRATVLSWNGVVPLNSIHLNCFCDVGFPEEKKINVWEFNVDFH